jgi:hypothetical protein
MAKRVSRNVFGVALRRAQKELTDKLRERMQAQNIVNRLNYEIPHLQQMITTLEAQVHPGPNSSSGQKIPAYTPTVEEVSPEMGFLPGDLNRLREGAPTPTQEEFDLEAALPPSARNGEWK